MSVRKPPRSTRRTAGSAARSPKRTAKAGARSTKTAASATPARATLARRVRELSALLEAERVRHARQLAALRRKTDRELAAMVGEIAALRHHEARAVMLARVLEEHGIAVDQGSARMPQDSDAQAPHPPRG